MINRYIWSELGRFNLFYYIIDRYGVSAEQSVQSDIPAGSLACLWSRKTGRRRRFVIAVAHCRHRAAPQAARTEVCLPVANEEKTTLSRDRGCMGGIARGDPTGDGRDGAGDRERW
jgi:hypothetical protein